MASRSVSWAALLVGLLSPGVVLAANCGMVSTCPSASLPLSGTELFYLVQNGQSKKTTVGALTSTTTPPGGTNGQVQYNHSGAFGGFTVSGDGTLNTSTGALTVTKSSGVAFGTAAFINTPISVANGGTGVGSLTTNGPLYGGTTVGATAAMTSGQVLVGQTGAAPAPETISGDCSLTSGGAMTCTKSSGSSFGTAAFANTGSSGHTLPFLDGIQVWSGTNGFNNNVFQLQGSSSGAVIVNAPAVAGSNTATVPANTGTIAELNLAQTWTATQVFATIGSYLANVQSFSGTSCTFTGTSNAGCSAFTGGNGDCGTFVSFTSASGITVTISSSLPVGCQVALEQNGAGTVSLSAGSGATLHTAHSFTGTTAGQYSTIGITVTANSGGSAAVAVMTGDGA